MEKQPRLTYKRMLIKQIDHLEALGGVKNDHQRQLLDHLRDVLTRVYQETGRPFYVRLGQRKRRKMERNNPRLRK